MKVIMQERLRFALGGINVVEYGTGEQDLDPEAAAWAIENGIATAVATEDDQGEEPQGEDSEAEGVEGDSAEAPARKPRAGKKPAAKPIGDAS